MKIIEEFNNGIEDCVKLDNEHKILDKATNVAYNPPISVIKRLIGNYLDTDLIIDPPEEEPAEFDPNFNPNNGGKE